jgi:hypothetical protein
VTAGTDALASAHAKLNWAESRHEQMQRTFVEFARPGGGDERPYGIHFREQMRPAGFVTATFIEEQPMPVELSLLAADLVHNTRVAVDHVLAQLKDHFGGNAGRGFFPTCERDDDWERIVVRAGRRSPLQGLANPAVDLIYSEQPLHRDGPSEDPLVILNRLDNADKHRLLYPAYVYTGVECGLDLIEVVERRRVVRATNSWRAGQALEHGTSIAEFLIRGPARETLRARTDAPIGFASGDRNVGQTSYAALIDRARAIVYKAAVLIDSQCGTAKA